MCQFIEKLQIVISMVVICIISQFLKKSVPFVNQTLKVSAFTKSAEIYDIFMLHKNYIGRNMIAREYKTDSINVYHIGTYIF